MNGPDSSSPTPDAPTQSGQSKETLTWEQIVDHCSRLHTTRRRPEGPWEDAELREDSRPLKILIDEFRVAMITPTRMYEPGFYWRYADQISGTINPHADELKRMAEAGRVTRWKA